jgi:hypothetical protein
LIGGRALTVAAAGVVAERRPLEEDGALVKADFALFPGWMKQTLSFFN